MTQDDLEAAAAAIVEGDLALENLAELHGRLAPCFGRVETFAQSRKYMTGLISDLPRKNAWTIAEHAGDATPDRMQRLLNRAVWDTDAAMAVVGQFVAENLGPVAAGRPRALWWSRRWTRLGSTSPASTRSGSNASTWGARDASPTA